MASVFRVKAVAALALFLIASTGCSGERAWNAAKAANTSYGYREFLRLHPGSKFSAEAHDLLGKSIWERATRSNRPAIYREYLNAYPHGEYSDQARMMLDTLLLSQWRITQERDTILSYEEFLRVYGDTKFADQAIKRIAELREEGIAMSSGKYCCGSDGRWCKGNAWHPRNTPCKCFPVGWPHAGGFSGRICAAPR